MTLTMPKPNTREVRVATEAWPLADLEIRAEGDGMTFTGYAAVFNSPSEDLGGFRETIAPGAFARSLKRDRNIRMFLNHNTDVVLGATKAGTLRLAEDAKGLIVSADLPETTAGRDLAYLLARGDVDSMSFGFQTVRDTWTDASGNRTGSFQGVNRTLEEVRLFEVSPVTGWPAYPATSASVRSLDDLAAFLLADPAALAAAIEKLANGQPLMAQEAELLCDAIEHLGPPPDPAMEMDAAHPFLEAARALLTSKGIR